MQFLWQHWLIVLVIAFIFYVVGEKYPNALKGIPVVGQYT